MANGPAILIFEKRDAFLKLSKKRRKQHKSNGSYQLSPPLGVAASLAQHGATMTIKDE